MVPMHAPGGGGGLTVSTIGAAGERKIKVKQINEIKKQIKSIYYTGAPALLYT